MNYNSWLGRTMRVYKPREIMIQDYKGHQAREEATLQTLSLVVTSRWTVGHPYNLLL
eukprot:c4688_g1_i1 orf=431-601(+)